MQTQHVSSHTVESADGTVIGYRKLGSGSPIILVHGSISTGEQWLAVAEQLADANTVYIMDRRGRGLSADAEDYSLNTESDDIKALLDVAGKGASLLGHSYGAICALEAVRTGSVRRLTGAVRAPAACRWAYSRNSFGGVRRSSQGGKRRQSDACSSSPLPAHLLGGNRGSGSLPAVARDG